MEIRLVAFTPSENKKELKNFIELQYTLNKNDPAWVAPLRMQVKDNLDTKKNPFYKHARIQLWNAYRDKKHIGRIAAIVDDVHNNTHKEQIGFWGFFECENDPAVAKILFAAAEAWVKQAGMKAIRGPASPSFNHECGLLINNFERAPYIMMTHNLPYYPALVEKAGYQKSKDLLAFEMSSSQPFPERVVKLAERVKRKENIRFRPLDKKNFWRDIEMIQGIYNSAWQDNWGFVPMNAEEFNHTAKGMKDIVWPELVLIAEAHGEPIGFSVCLPDINQVLKDIPDGKLFPFGVFKLLTGLRPLKGKVTQARVITLGVKEKYRASGVASMFYFETYRVAKKLGVAQGEMSWILEDNEQMLSAIQVFAGVPPYKTYRIYDKLFS